jgi:hypothetical protein
VCLLAGRVQPGASLPGNIEPLIGHKLVYVNDECMVGRSDKHKRQIIFNALAACDEALSDDQVPCGGGVGGGGCDTSAHSRLFE